MKLVKIMRVIFLGATMFLLTACGEVGNADQNTSENAAPAQTAGVYVPNQTGKPMSEDIKDELESKHKQEAAAIKTIQEEPKGSHKGQRILIAYFT
jgi:uncharacterized lipoprotein YajG